MSGRNFLGQLVLFQDGTQCDQGAIVGVSITGAKYYPDPDLN